MIDKSKKYWTGDCAADIDEWLRLRKCPVCKSCKEYNLRVGFARRENGSVKWVYIGNRCTGCGTLGSYLDWKINYEPTDEMERNI